MVARDSIDKIAGSDFGQQGCPQGKNQGWFLTAADTK